MNWLLAVAAAVLLVLCFPPFGVAWLAPLALAPLLLACMREKRPWRRFAMGYVAGIVYWGGVCPWIQFTLAAHGGVGEAGGWVLFALFCLFKALQLGAFAWLAGYAADSRFSAMMLAGLWTAIEYTHAPLFFAWLQLGNAAIDLPLPLRLAPYTGVWGISFLFALTAAALALAVGRRPGQLLWLAAWPALWLFPRLPAAAPVTHAAVMVQPNVDENEQFTERSYALLRDRLAALSLGPLLGKPAGQTVDLVVWPEIPAPLAEDDPRFVRLAREVTSGGHAWLLTGLLGRAHDSDVYNSAALFSPDGRQVSRYDKVHLVPFGEFVPWPFGALAHKVSSEVSDFVPGDHIVVSQINGHGLSAFICYESVFPSFIRDSVASGAEVLVNPSNDGWFGKTAARYQHVQIVRMRAVENARWILRGTNDGITAAIDPAGRIAQSLAGYTEITARMGFDYRTGLTPYTQWGDWFQVICFGLAAWPPARRLLSLRRH